MDANRLREEMTKAGLSQAELARRLGCSQPAVHSLLNGAQPKAPLYEKLLRELPALGTDIGVAS